MYIEVKKGLDCAYFGSSIEDIKYKFGEPDKIYVTNYEDLEYLYFKEELIFQFEKDIDMRLGLIQVYNKNIGLKNFPNIWKASKDILIKNLSKHPLFEYTLEDYGNMEVVCFENMMIDFEFVLGSLDCITFRFDYDENDMPIFYNSVVH